MYDGYTGSVPGKCCGVPGQIPTRPRNLIDVKSDPGKLLERHAKLIHSELQQVTSHVQRRSGDWIVNTLMVAGCEVPFRYKRKRLYRNLEGARVNLTYYPASEVVAGIEIEVMNVVRVRRS